MFIFFVIPDYFEKYWAFFTSDTIQSIHTRFNLLYQKPLLKYKNKTFFSAKKRVSNTKIKRAHIINNVKSI